MLELIFGNTTTVNELIDFPLKANQTLRCDLLGDYRILDTSLKGTWKGKIITFIKWFFFRSTHNSIESVLSQFEKTIIKTHDISKILSQTKKAKATLKSLKKDLDQQDALHQDINAFNARIFSKKFPAFKQAAEQEHLPQAELALGFCYLTGIKVEKNAHTAFHWYAKAAHREYPEAQLALAYLYREGKGTDQNPQLSFYWIQKAAHHGYAEAQNILGTCYELGYGTDKDLDKALSYYKKAAEQKLPAALFNIGRYYEETEKESLLARSFNNRAADHNDPLALKRLEESL